MELKFRIQTKIAKPVEIVFQAATSKEELCRYFTKAADKDLSLDATVKWSWGNGTANDVFVIDFVPNKKIVFSWQAHQVDYKTEVTFLFESLDDDSTMFTIIEHGWNNDEKGRESSYDHCQGWQHMLLCLRAYLKYGIDLRIA